MFSPSTGYFRNVVSGRWRSAEHLYECICDTCVFLRMIYIFTTTPYVFDFSCVRTNIFKTERSEFCILMIDRKPNEFTDVFRIFHPKRENAFTCWDTLLSELLIILVLEVVLGLSLKH